MFIDVYWDVKQLQNKKQKSGLDLGFLERGFKFTTLGGFDLLIIGHFLYF